MYLQDININLHGYIYASFSHSSTSSLTHSLFLTIVCLRESEREKSSIEAERTTTGWAARDPSGILSPYTYTLRNTSPEDVYVKVIYCGICHTDIHLIENYFGKSNYPMVPGHEVVGEVVEVGSDVSKFRAGDMVGVGYIIGCCRNCHPCKNDIPQYCNKTILSLNDVYTDDKPTQGGFASAMVVDQK